MGEQGNIKKEDSVTSNWFQMREPGMGRELLTKDIPFDEKKCIVIDPKREIVVALENDNVLFCVREENLER